MWSPSFVSLLISSPHTFVIFLSHYSSFMCYWHSHSNFSSYFFFAHTHLLSVEVLIDKRNNQLSAKTCRTRSNWSHSFKSERQTDRYRFRWHLKWPISMSLMSNSNEEEFFFHFSLTIRFIMAWKWMLYEAVIVIITIIMGLAIKIH